MKNNYIEWKGLSLQVERDEEILVWLMKKSHIIKLSDKKQRQGNDLKGLYENQTKPQHLQSQGSEQQGC